MNSTSIIALSLAAFTLFASLGVALADPGKLPAVGDTAPLVEGKDQDGKTWKLADELGKKAVLLYFYPKDETPGCTREACGLRDRMSHFTGDETVIVGVSFDDADSHKSFIAKNSLTFPLLADTDGKIADAYGVRMPDKNMARRVSFLIGKDGKIFHVTDNPNAEVHIREMTSAVAKLPKAHD